MDHPCRDLPNAAFRRRAVAGVPDGLVDPVTRAPCGIGARLGEMAPEEAEVVPDRLADLRIFPVCPAHARRLGIAGHLRFRPRLRQDRSYEVMDLPKLLGGG